MKPKLIDAIVQEIEFRAPEFQNHPITTVYFGGGTPSLLHQEDLQKIFKALGDHFDLSKLEECTLEANPDDLTLDKIQELRESPIDRLSIGIQSFREEDLQLMNRAHNAEEAHRCIDQVKQAGFQKMTIDLIYGTPGLSNEQWLDNLEQAKSYGIPHLSCYALTVEPKTALAHQIKKGQLIGPNDQQIADQFLLLMDFAESNQYEHYEISNFAFQGHRAVHNTSYWKGVPYLGFGPSAHSFHSGKRCWNVSNNALYIKAIEEGLPLLECEELSIHDHYNEWILTHLRTSDGIQLAAIIPYPELIRNHFKVEVLKWINSGHIIEQNQILTLSKKGKLMADAIASDLFFVE